MLVCSFLHAELSIYEGAILKTAVSPNNPDLSRHALLDKTLATVRAWFDAFFSISVQRHPGVSFTLWAQIGHCLMVLLHLGAREDPTWSRTAIQGDLELGTICDRLADIYADASKHWSLPGGDPDALFVRARHIIDVLRNSWMAEIAANAIARRQVPSVQAEQQQEQQQEQHQTGLVDGLGGTGSSLLTAPMYQADDAWLTDIFQVSWD